MMLVGCGGGTRTEDAAQAADGLELKQESGVVTGRFAQAGAEASFSSKQVEEGVYRIEVRQNGMTLTGLVDTANGVSDLDGFGAETGQDTQMLDGDREVLSGLYAALNAQLPAGDAAAPEAKYLRRAVSLWSQHPASVELQRTVMGEEGRGYTMLCSYAKCNGTWTGSCGGYYNWYSYAKHDCQHGGFDYTGNQQIAQLGDHFSCSGDEYYMSGGSWVCGEPDHWSRPKVIGSCFGRCGGGCGGDTQYTLDATNHDGCVRNGHALASAYCDDQFTSASDDEMFAGNCY
ncbi:putative lipoprotein [Archangium gephyra]|uniref:Lipoprotein n=1 Tax=Archangium gephyra TaxID=48 RepID=A0AAC8QJE1_9BACT|nr:putative lipoprotein [Archangium gephyra]